MSDASEKIERLCLTVDLLSKQLDDLSERPSENADGLRNDIEELRNDIEELRLKLGESEDASAAGPISITSSGGANEEVEDVPVAFTVQYDDIGGRWCVFVPSGSLFVGKKEVEFANAEDGGVVELPVSEGTQEFDVYCHVVKDKDGYSATLDIEESGDVEEGESKIADFKVAHVEATPDGSCSQIAHGTIIIGGSEVVGDYDGSEVINGDGEPILITGHPGEEDEQGHDSHSGLQFLTVGARTDEETGEKIPPKIVARIIDKAEDEDWAARSLTVTPAEGSPKTVHFLGSEDIDIEIPSVPEPPDPLGSSDYIDVDTAVSAKVATPANQQAANAPNALLTHNTDQLVRSKKTFLGLGSDDNALKKVIVDGPNGKIEVQNAAGNRIIKLDAADIPNECGQGGAATIQVRKLTVTHPRAKDGKTADVYHVIGCADIDVQEGDAIQSITSGAPTQSGGFTVTPVTITLKDGTSLPAFNVSAKNGADGDDGTPAGFGTPTATATELEAGFTPTASVSASGPDTAKVFAFQFGIPKGKGEQSDWEETDSSADSFIKNKPTIPAEQVNADWNATSGKAQILNKPTIPTIPDITATPSGTGNVVTGVTANGHALTVTKGTVKGNVQSDWNATSGDAQILNKPASLKNPYSLTIKKNGSSDVVYDGSEAKTVEICKTIKETKVTASADPNGMNTIKFIYTDGTYDEFKVMNGVVGPQGPQGPQGLPGTPGSPGQPGHSPNVSVSEDSNYVYIKVDNVTKATIPKASTHLSQQVNYIADMRYDTATHYFQKLMGHIATDGTVTVDTNWTNMTGGETTPLSAE